MDLKNQAPRSVNINCGNLDMRDMTEEVASRIKHINTGNVMVSPETRSFLTMFSINMGNVIEVPRNARMIYSDEILGRDAFSDDDEPIAIVNFGGIILEPDVTAESVDASWGDIINLGSIFYPEHVAGPITRKLKDNKGSLTPYRSSGRLTIGDVMMDEAYLESLPDDAELVIGGNLQGGHVLPNDLLGRKIKTIHVTETVVCCEENAQTLRSRFDPKAGAPETHVIPAGYELVEQDLSMSAGSIQAWNGRKVDCTGKVTIHDDVEADALDRALAGLIATETVLCPDSLSEVLSKKCDTLNINVIFYGGALWIEEGNLTLRKSRFDFLDGTATLLNSGNVTIEEDVAPQVLYDHLSGIYNWGNIFCFPEQTGAIEARMVVNEGILLDATPSEEDAVEEEPAEDDGTLTINTGNCKL